MFIYYAFHEKEESSIIVAIMQWLVDIIILVFPAFFFLYLLVVFMYKDKVKLIEYLYPKKFWLGWALNHLPSNLLKNLDKLETSLLKFWE